MCNLYRMRASRDEVARMFGAEPPAGANFADELYPGYPGLVTAHDQARVMHWGFPVVLTGKDGRKLKPKSVTNARDDKLLSPFWRSSFEKRRCLIPVTQWAEPEGEPGKMTRTWYSLPKADVVAIAGLWGATDLWGRCYAMVMVDSCPEMAHVHDRMPVILACEDWSTWLDGSIEAALATCKTWHTGLVTTKTTDRWAQ